ncbi:iron transporter [Halorubrum sp. 2020YC2]|uniref:iron transporter n=1 Tax=Halorubrum sp. 2020YC2 TaxID=2836432 RepID=UPI001BE98E3A|nr:iron transporter [Halorubrum sp. 2020YC2]QWC20536.1 iron transporter [Halorubrum sp. 2020YC2]
MTRDTTPTDRGEPTRTHSRRRALALAATGAGALSGCLTDSGSDIVSEGGADDGSGGENGSGADGGSEGEGGGGAAPSLPRVEDPPAATYVPTHFEAMRRLDPVEAGEYLLEPMVTYPHRFWNVTGDRVEEAAPTDEHDVHLMVTVRDAETGRILPAETGLRVTVGREGESGTPNAPWPMVSQEMGFHFGDNLSLDGDGTYEATVRVGAIDARKTGSFAGRFEEPATGSFTFEYDRSFRESVIGDIAYVREESDWGARGAMANGAVGRGGGRSYGDADRDGPDHVDAQRQDADRDHRGEPRWEARVGDRRYGTYWRPPEEGELPPAAHLPGTLQGEPVLGDALLAASLLSPGSRFVDGDERYLAVSPRTPYNRSMLPMTAIDYALRREGETVASGSLDPALDDEVGHHYGTALGDAASGDELTLSVTTPSNASRHAGYETALLETGEVSLALEVDE